MRKLQKLVAKLYRRTCRNVCVIRQTLSDGRAGPYLVYDLDTIVDSSYHACVIGRFDTVASCEAFLVSLFR